MSDPIDFDMTAQIINVTIEEGDDFRLPLVVQEAGVAYDWSGATIDTEVRLLPSAVTLMVFDTTPTAGGNLLVYKTYAGLTSGGLVKGQTYRYAVAIIKSSTRRTFFKGTFKIKPSVNPS